MTITRAIPFLLLASVSAWAQMGGAGSMRDPRDTNTSGAGTFQPWLSVNGIYDTSLDLPAGTQSYLARAVNLGGGLSAVKSFRRTSLIFSYAGSGSDYIGRSSGSREGWKSSNVGTLAVSSQVTERLTLDFSELGGAGNGGFGAASAGLSSGGLGVLGSVGLSSGSLFGGSGGLGGVSTGLDPSQNGLVDADYSLRMAYFSGTSAGVGILLSQRTMLNIGGTASFIRREGNSYSDSNMVGANVMLSTRLSRRFATFIGYSFNHIDYTASIGKVSMQGGFAGLQYTLSPHDQVSVSITDSYLDSKLATTVTLPPDVAALLGVSSTTTVSANSRSYAGGRLMYAHAFQRGGFDLSCMSSVAPGNDLILLARTEGCSVTLSRSLTDRFSVSGLGGLRRLNGLSQSGSRYDVLSGGLVFSYRIFRGLALTAGSTYRYSQIQPSAQSLKSVSANAGLYWSPAEGPHLF